jgi:hypothetical protein
MVVRETALLIPWHHVLWYLQQHMAGIMQSPSGHSLSSLECCAGAPAPAVVNPEDIDLGDGMEEDDEAEEPAAEVQLQQKAVPVRLVSSSSSLPALVVDTAALKLSVANCEAPKICILQALICDCASLTEESMPSSSQHVAAHNLAGCISCIRD